MRKRKRLAEQRAETIGHVVCAHLVFEPGPSRIRDFIAAELEKTPDAEFNAWMDGDTFHIEMLPPEQAANPWRRKADAA